MVVSMALDDKPSVSSNLVIFAYITNIREKTGYDIGLLAISVQKYIIAYCTHNHVAGHISPNHTLLDLHRSASSATGHIGSRRRAEKTGVRWSGYRVLNEDVVILYG
jgi:hypothetical protein